jgi:hypothetical protein
VSDEARERWRKQYRRQRVRAPKVALARNVAAAFMLLATIAFAALGLLVEWGWGAGAFVSGYLFLRLRGIRPFEGGPGEGFDAYVD